LIAFLYNHASSNFQSFRVVFIANFYDYEREVIALNP